MHAGTNTPFLRSLFLGLLCVVACTPASAQVASTPLAEELCECSSALDLTLPDATVERGFRFCLENAIVHHPKEIRQYMSSTGPDANKGYVLGRVLGELLDRHCPGSKELRDRLRMMQSSSEMRAIAC